jgi:hypothetical protein
MAATFAFRKKVFYTRLSSPLSNVPHLSGLYILRKEIAAEDTERTEKEKEKEKQANSSSNYFLSLSALCPLRLYFRKRISGDLSLKG